MRLSNPEFWDEVEGDQERVSKEHLLTRKQQVAFWAFSLRKRVASDAALWLEAQKNKMIKFQVRNTQLTFLGVFLWNKLRIDRKGVQ